MFKKRVLEFSASVDIDGRGIGKFLTTIPSDIKIKQDEDCSAVFNDYISKRFERIKKYSDEILFTKKHINGDNSIAIIGSLINHDPKDPIGVVRIKGFKVEYSDMIELVYTFSNDKIEEGKSRQDAYALDPTEDGVNDLIETSIKYKKEFHVAELKLKCKCNVAVKEIENTPNKRVFNYIDDNDNVLDTLMVEVIR